MVMTYLTKERMQYSVKVFVRRGYTVDAWDSVKYYMITLVSPMILFCVFFVRYTNNPKKPRKFSTTNDLHYTVINM